jgi:hypothetical protein
MCAPQATRHTSIRNSTSCHTRVNMGASILFTLQWSVPLGQRGHVAMMGRITGLLLSFYLYRFRKYVSYGFPIIHFCNPGVHYETPCIRTQSVPRCKHFPPRLKKPNFWCCVTQNLLFVQRPTQKKIGCASHAQISNSEFLIKLFSSSACYSFLYRTFLNVLRDYKNLF